jgi:hypothetical protein
MAMAAFSITLTACVGWSPQSRAQTTAGDGPIDRKAVVERHSPRLTQADTMAPMTVGNGNFAYSVDVTGMQSFQEDYHAGGGIPLETLSNWAWHSFPNPEGFKLSDSYTMYDVHGKEMGFPTDQRSAAGQWLRASPHRFPLGEIGMTLIKNDGTTATLADLSDIDQSLDMWTGTIHSRFKLDGTPVEVTTVCDGARDAVAFRIESPLLRQGRLKPYIRFPYAHTPRIKNKPPLDFESEDEHFSFWMRNGSGEIVAVGRVAGEFKYHVAFGQSEGAGVREDGKHKLVWLASGDALELTFDFQNHPPSAAPAPSFKDAARSSEIVWFAFWTNGGMIDLSRSSDPRWKELERRVILSLYLTRSQECGDMVPQESGLTHNSWHGKHHLEMTWWHLAHFFPWGRPELAERPMAWYHTILPVAKATAAERGLTGARWSKMVGIDGRESPGGNPHIIWNQPHIVYLAELAYRAHPDRKTLENYKDLVLETAECMASFAYYEKEKDRYVLGPPLWLAQELYDQRRSQNPTYELAYWHWGLETAQQWRERLGMARDAKWDEVIAKLSPLPVKDGKYPGLESIPDTWDNVDSRHDHPSMLMALGFVPETPMVDRPTMARTLDAVMEHWDWEVKIWGWDYPMIAMTAARLNQPERAIDVLLYDGPNNHYMATGHVPVRDELPVYLPANGSLLSAIGMMAGGWEGAPEIDAPGFPRNGWVVKHEGMKPLP